MPIDRLHVITAPVPAAELLDRVGRVIGAGAPAVQLRTKGGTDRERYGLAADVRARCEAAGTQLILNDRADIAVAAGAAGVHVGADDLPVAAVRSVVGPRLVVGATCRDAESARRAEAEGADYLGVGPSFDTTTKEGLPAAIGPAGVARVAAAVRIPVIAIGGVTAARVPALLDAGAHGVAVVGAVFSAPDPAAAVAELLDALVVATA
jgi:thiamine-phosphate pyrophosphorylase